MVKIAKVISIIIASFAVSSYAYIVESDFLYSFLSENALLVAVAVFSIHVSSVSILIYQIGVISLKEKYSFEKTVKAIKDSFVEEGIIVFCVLLVSVSNSSANPILQTKIARFILSGSVVFLLVSQLLILYDVLKSVMDMFIFTNCLHKK